MIVSIRALRASVGSPRPHPDRIAIIMWDVGAYIINMYGHARPSRSGVHPDLIDFHNQYNTPEQ